MVKLGEGPTVILGTHDTTFTLCSGRPHHVFKIKSTARDTAQIYICTDYTSSTILTAYFVMLHCFVRNVFLLLCPVQLCCYKKLFSNQMRGLRTLHFCATPRCLFGRELSVRKKVSLSVEQSSFSHTIL